MHARRKNVRGGEHKYGIEKLVERVALGAGVSSWRRVGWAYQHRSPKWQMAPIQYGHTTALASAVVPMHGGTT